LLAIDDAAMAGEFVFSVAFGIKYKIKDKIIPVVKWRDIAKTNFNSTNSMMRANDGPS